MIELIVGFFDAQGRLMEAISEIEHAIARSKADPPTLAVLTALRATFLSATGEPTAAAGAIAASEAAQSQTTNHVALGRSTRLCAATRMTTLTAENLPEIEHLMEMGTGEELESSILHLVSIYVPYRFALGQGIDARPWTRGLRMSAEAIHHAYRLADAQTFERADATISSLETPTGEGLPEWNWLARWRVQTLRLYIALLRRETAPARKDLSGLLRARRRAGEANLDGIDAFQANVRATAAAPDQTVNVPRPGSLHLLNLGSMLAGAEAVGTAGSQSEAAAWYEWLTTAVPERIQSSMEWPVSRLRVQGLLALRAGDPRNARYHFEHALEWADHASYPVEQALAQVQLAEFYDQYGPAQAPKTIPRLRDAGWKRLLSLGIDPAPHAYIVARKTVTGSPRPTLSPLTRRETETLVLLAEGLTYREIAERMGVRWPTVQALAHRCYDKLNASGRAAAVQAGHDLGIF